MPTFPIIDTHVHLMDVGRHSYPGLEAEPRLHKTHLMKDFDERRGGVDVEAVVFLEVAVADDDQIAELEFVDEQAASDARIKAIVASAQIERGAAVEEQLDRVAEFDLVRGVRRLIQNQPDPEFCIRPDFIEGVRRVGARGWHFEICVYHNQLGAALELARQCPDVPLILDHIGKPCIRDDIVEPWWSQIKTLSRMPHVQCKVSGVVTEADHERWTESQIKPYLARVFDCFGTERTMFGSDWPVAELTHRYPDWVAMLDRFTADFSKDEQRAFYRDNAIAFYRLDV